MSKNDNCDSVCSTDTSCCETEAIVKIDDRGQILFPKDLRTDLNIKPGDKFIVVTMKKKDGNIGFFSLIKANEFTGIVENFIAPIVAEINS